MFTKRDLTENHYKTVAHQIECRKLQKEEEVKKTKIKEELEYRRRLFEMKNFKARPYTVRKWETEATLLIPLESKEPLQNPRRKPQKQQIFSTCKIPEKSKKTENSKELNAKAIAKPQVIDGFKPDTEDTTIGIILHITESDEKLFPECQSKEACKYGNSEIRRVSINNDWKIKDSIGITDFDDVVATNPDFDWLSFISENNLF